MPLNPITAASIARSLGLTLADAASLARMCETESEAWQVGRLFQPQPGEPGYREPDRLLETLKQKLNIHDEESEL